MLLQDRDFSRWQAYTDNRDQARLGLGGETLLLSEQEPLVLQAPEQRGNVWHSQYTLQVVLALSSVVGEIL